MTTELIGTLFLSEKRKNLMIYLLDGPMTIDQIKTELNVTTSAIMTQIKILMDQGLVRFDNGVYSLTIPGEVISGKMIPLLATLETYSSNQKYWMEHKPAFPAALLSRIGDLQSCVLEEPELSRLYELPLKFEENLLKSEKIREISSFFSPVYQSVYTNLIQNGAEIDLILPPSAFERFKTDYGELLLKYLQSPNFRLYVYEELIEIASAVITDHFFSVSLFSNSGIYHNHCLMSFAPSSLSWGETLFNYYLEKAVKISGEDF
ncbi:MAG: winged helix-turn-helix domain-containing protein [Methanosarcinales archaeon]|jgi:predicted transcriptional regulator|nr:winged helix-turn-helix domain-containing protein [Methanosarcinales archaeon]